MAITTHRAPQLMARASSANRMRLMLLPALSACCAIPWGVRWDVPWLSRRPYSLFVFPGTDGTGVCTTARRSGVGHTFQAVSARGRFATPLYWPDGFAQQTTLRRIHPGRCLVSTSSTRRRTLRQRQTTDLRALKPPPSSAGTSPATPSLVSSVLAQNLCDFFVCVCVCVLVPVRRATACGCDRRPRSTHL